MTRRVNSSKPVKQKFVEQFAAFAINTVGCDYRVRRNLPHYRQNA